tara:strand:- start:81 stop:950 length:870 start_codon:yes stop_codon:yes gene_type:complete
MTLIKNAQKLAAQKFEEHNVKDGDNYNTMTIDRNQLIAEELIRDHIRKRISFKLKKQRLAEEKIRKAVRYLIEAETGTEEASRSTGINVLADLLEKIVPVIEDDYKMLTTSDDQRKSFRNHIIHAIENSLRPIESQNQGEQATENIEYEIDVDLLREKLSIDLGPQDDGKEEQSIEGEFIDIDNDGQEDDGFVQIEDQNETGRNFAAVTFRAVEKQIVDAYDMLADEEDKDVFYDYLLTNMMLYFDKFEDELRSDLPDVTTDEYDSEQENDEDTEASSEEFDSDSELEI